VISHKAQDNLLAGTNVQFLADFLGKNNLSFGGCFYNGHVFYPGKKVLLYVWNMTELKKFVKIAVLLPRRCAAKAASKNNMYIFMIRKMHKPPLSPFRKGDEGGLLLW
jgi:hypothetical protein